MAASFLQTISELFGWVYTLCWSLSFYPQPILNFRRRSTTGTTIDFPVINVVGFVAYFISCTAFIYSPEIRREYAARHHGLTPTVQINDLAFAAHASVITLITVTQFIPGLWGFDKKGRKGHGSRISNGILGIIMGSFLAVGIIALIVAIRHDPDPKTGWAWIDTVCGLLPSRASSSINDFCMIDLRLLLRQTRYHPRQIHASSPYKLSK
jgi:cystinosin